VSALILKTGRKSLSDMKLAGSKIFPAQSGISYFYPFMRLSAHRITGMLTKPMIFGEFSREADAITPNLQRDWPTTRK